MATNINPSTDTSLEARVENIERILQRIEAQLDQVPGLVATAGDTFDTYAVRAVERGVDIDERLAVAARLVERLTDPAIANLLEQALDVAKDGRGLVAAAGDTFDELAAAAQAHGVDFEPRLRGLVALVERLTRPATLGAVGKAMDVVDMLGQALADSATREPPSTGLFGMLRAMGHANAKVALGFTANLLDRFGEQLRNSTAGKNLLGDNSQGETRE